MSDWRSAFTAISNALAVISAAANTPGINLIPYVSTVAAAAGAMQTALNVGVNIAPYIEAIADTFSGKLPTEAQRIALGQKIAELEAKVDAPLPPKEADEPD